MVARSKGSKSKSTKSPQSKRKGASRKRAGKGVPDRALKAALRVGREQAAAVFAAREPTRARRAAAVRRHIRALRERAPAEAVALEGAGATRAGVLVAEGDSWFDYPFYDVLKLLEDDYGYDVETVAHRGDAIEEMAYGGGQLDDFARRLERVLRNGITPKALLLSGGGNDVAGDVFAMLINHRLSPSPGLNVGILEGVVEQRIKVAYATILSAVTQLCRQYVGAEVPILVHGYDYPVPDGRGFFGGFGPLPGPWLEPGFREKGYDDLDQRIDIAEDLIDRFNRMVGELSALPEFAHVRFVDLRNTLSNDRANYRTWWGNELHPTRRGFEAVTARFATVLDTL
jgi:lysophospholipase L1-like esterase